MTSPSDQYRDYVEQSQQAFQSAVDTWTKTVEQTVSAIPTNPGRQLDPQKVVDQVFDFAERMLEMQRDFTKNLISNSITLTKTATGQQEADSQPASDV